ncbi:hypothetical protein [Leclercia sp. M50]|uniref:hypothetical protein n=1 Tax=Leclercia sp. M50 TaxID=3081258 RepID=UPI00301A87E5
MESDSITQTNVSGSESLVMRASLLSFRNLKLLAEGSPKLSIVEFLIYSDSRFSDQVLTEQGYSFLNMLAFSEDTIAPTLTVRVDWAVDINKTIFSGTEPHTSDFHGGWFTDEIGALISLKLGIRAHAGSISRDFNCHSPTYGQPRSETNPPPPILSNGKSLVVPSCRKRIAISNLDKINTIHNLNEMDFNYLIKAARSFQDSLWICESSPNLSWLLLVSALETAAQQWDQSKITNIQRLKEAKPELMSTLESDAYRDLIPLIAEEFSSTLGAAKKFRDFCVHFLPDEPNDRPEHGKIDWKKKNLRNIFNKIYELRSLALHTGQPFPYPMCCTPDKHFGIAEQAITSLATSTLGATWTPKEAPITLNIFVHMAHSILNKWWDNLYRA